MHDLFISYAREDADWIERFSEMLKSEGLVAWKDSSIPTGKSYGRVIEDAIANSRAVVVVWSHYSVESDWVRAEATEGLARGILMPVRKDKTAPPLRFRTVQTIDLASWQFESEYPAFRGLVSELRNLVQSPQGNPKSETGKQTMAVSYSGTGARRKLMVIAGVLLAAAVAGAVWFWQGAENRSRLSLELTAAARAALDEVEAGYKASRRYWRFYLADAGGEALVEKGVLLALEAVKADATAEAIEELRQSLVLLQRPLQEFGYANTTGSVEIASGGARLAWSDGKGIKFLDTEDAAKSRDLAFDGRVAGLAFLADGEYLLAIGGGGTLKVWNLANGKQLSAVEGSGGNLIGFAVASGGSRVAVRQAGLVTVFELPGGRRIAEIETDRFVNLSAYQSLDLSPDGTLLAIAPKDEVVIWDLEQREERFRIAVGRRLSSLSFDPAGKHLLAFATDGNARMINPTYGDAIDFSLQRGADLIRFSATAGRVAFASGGQVQVALLAAPDKPIVRYSHADNVKDIRFSEDGRMIASAGQDGMVRVWDIEADREVSRFAYRDQVLAIRFSRDGKRLTAVARSGEVGIWPIAYDDPATEACRGLKRNLTPEEWHRHLGPQPYRKTCTN